jgi:hypothetical protein
MPAAGAQAGSSRQGVGASLKQLDYQGGRALVTPPAARSGGDQGAEVERRNARQLAERLLRAFQGMGTDTQEVFRVLNQPAPLLARVRQIYDAELNRHTGRGLVADLEDELGGRDLEIAKGLLARAGMAVGGPGAAEGYDRQEESGRYASNREITATPHVPVAVPGTQVTYEVGSKTGYMYATGSYFSYEWYCYNDPDTSKAAGAPAVVRGPSSAKWEAKWDFPGNHKVVCRVQFHPAGKKAEPPRWVEFQQTVMAGAAVLNKGFGEAKAGSDPAAQLRSAEAYQKMLLAAEGAKGSQKLSPETREAVSGYVKGLKKKLETTEGRQRIPIRAVHLSRADARLSTLNAFVAKVGDRDGQQEWALIDLTNPTDRRLSGEYRGKGKTAAEAIQAAIDDWDSDNRYADGVIRLEVPAQAAGAPIARQFQTDGMSFWDSMSEFFNRVGLVAGIVTLTAAVVTAVVPDPTISKVASAALWTSILAGTAASAINIGQRRAEGIVDLRADLFDSMTIAGNILGGAWMKGATVLSASKAGCRFATGLVIAKASTDAVQGVLIASMYVAEYDQIMKDPSPESRSSRMLALLGKAAATGGMIVLSFRSTRADLERIGASSARLDATRLGTAGETVDLGAPTRAQAPAVDEAAQAATPKKTPAAGAAIDAGDPLKLKIDELMGSDQAQRKLFDLATQTTSDMDSRLKGIAAKFDGGDAVSTIKRDNLQKFVEEVRIKCTRERYETVGAMGDMSRGRINLQNGGDAARAVEELQAQFAGRVAKVKPPQGAYPRWHVVVRHDTGLLYEIQVGSFATTTFLEKITVQLPEAFMKAMGKAKPDIDFHDVMYKGLMKFKGTAVWEKYDLASFEARYSAALKASGDGVLDSALNQNLQREIQAMLDGIAATDAAVLAKVFGR